MTWLLVVLCCLVFFLPLPFGGTSDWAIFGFEISTFFLGLLYLVTNHSKSPDGGLQQAEKKIIPSISQWLIIIFFIVCCLQIIPFPAAVVRGISPAAYNWRQTLVTSGLLEPARIKWQTVSLSPADSFYELVKYAAYGLFTFLLAKSINSRKKAVAVVLTLIGAAIFQALYGLSELFSGSHRIFNWVNRYYSGSAFGTFINRDHYSAFLEMIFPLSLGYFLARADYFAWPPGLSIRRKIAWFGQEKWQKSILFILPPIIIGVGLFFSRCRSGIIIFLLTFFLMILLLSVAGITGRRKTERRLVMIVTFVILIGVIMIGIQPILERFTSEDLFGGGRLFYYQYTLDMIKDYPLAGSGLGTYVKAINHYLKKDFRAILDHAHNDYLEMTAEAGLAGGGALILGGLLLFGLGIKRYLQASDSLTRGISLGALMGVLALFLHSLTDFSLRMPGNAVIWLSLFVLCLKVPQLGPVKLKVEKVKQNRGDQDD
ncbi:MAG: O-antigen ligase family protein [Acidobacteriota bacterium]|nr:O-antigen ligase family protein [Acidobacteriota bacterium]